MQPYDLDRARDEHWREVSRLTQMNHEAERVRAREAAANVVEAARWRLALGRSLIRLGMRLCAPPTPQVPGSSG